jgi:hypothetical protein
MAFTPVPAGEHRSLATLDAAPWPFLSPFSVRQDIPLCATQFISLAKANHQLARGGTQFEQLKIRERFEQIDDGAKAVARRQIPARVLMSSASCRWNLKK